MSTAELGLEDFLCSLSEIWLSLERREEGKIPSLAAVFLHPVTDQFQGWPKLSLWKLVYQMVKLFAHRAHGFSVRKDAATVRLQPRCVAVELRILIHAFQLLNGGQRQGRTADLPLSRDPRCPRSSPWPGLLVRSACDIKDSSPIQSIRRPS
jgi:hypothetical protein